MPKYRLKPVEVEAHQYTGERTDQLPSWAREHQGDTEFGKQSIGKDAVGHLLVPVAGKIVTCRSGDYLILNGDDLSVEPQRTFEDRYETVEQSQGEPA